MNTPNVLETIIAEKREEVKRHQEAVSIPILEKIIRDQEFAKRSFKEALKQSSTGIIAEFKRKSPSKGWIFEKADVASVVSGYEKSGASAISVLTDELFFGGNIADFKIARSCAKIPLLRKDFMVSEYQIYQAKAIGADVILLIASALSLKESASFSALAHSLGLEVLLEIHHEQELEYIQPDIDVVGINNRNLSTFVTDVQCSLDLGAKIPPSYLKISESGISDPQTVKELRKVGFRGFLMGENFMKTSDPAVSLKQFMNVLYED